MIEFDLVVIGAGSGGLVAATKANRLGLKTALIEKNKIGGECTHYGCVPSKTLLASAKQYEALKHLHNYGLEGLKISGSPDFAQVMEHVAKVINSIYKNETPEIFVEQGIDVRVNKEGAKFLNPHTLKVGEDILHFKNAIISTGSKPMTIKTPGSEEVSFLHNENFWHLRELPQSVAFIGGGVISAEIGQALSSFGSSVSILDRNDEILKILDPEIRSVIQEDFASRGMDIITSANIESFANTSGGVKINYSINHMEKQLEAEKVFLALGRKPNIEGLDLFKADIDITSKGIKVNQNLQTSQPHVFACGDVASSLKFTHAAAFQAEFIIDSLMGRSPEGLQTSAFPWAIFTQPEIGHVGLNETQARAKFSDNIQVFSLETNTDRFVTDGKTKGLLKVILDKADHVLGAEAIGAHAGEWIQIFTLIIKNKITPETMANTIFTYPSYSEIVKKSFTRFLRSKK